MATFTVSIIWIIGWILSFYAFKHYEKSFYGNWDPITGFFIFLTAFTVPYIAVIWTILAWINNYLLFLSDLKQKQNDPEYKKLIEHYYGRVSLIDLLQERD